MTKPIFLFAACLLSATGLAATEFERTVPVELARFFSGTTNIYSDLPDSFPPVAFPAQVSLMGSIDKGRIQQVLLRSSAAPEQAVDAMRGAFLDAGWSAVPAPGGNRPRRGFVQPLTTASPELPLELCHDDHGIMTLQGSSSGGNRVTLRFNRRNYIMPADADFSCEQYVQQREMAERGMMGSFQRPQESIIQYVPRLVMPPEDAQAGSRFGFFDGPYSGSNWDIETSARSRIPWSAAELYAHFAAQMTERGWELDSRWAGDISAGGNWRRSVDGERELVAILGIIQDAEESFELKLRVLARNLSAGANSADGFGIGLVRAGRTGPD